MFLEDQPDKFWGTPGKIITKTDPEFSKYLENPCSNIDSLEFGEKIAGKLFKTLSANKRLNGIALTANQIGIPYSVFVVNVINKLYFINPNIIAESDEQIPYRETCLSLPRKNSIIHRHINVTIKADNMPKPVQFGITPAEMNIVKYDRSVFLILLEVVAIQHEYGHTMGLLITDLDEKTQPILSDKKYGRNDIVKISKGDQVLETKYKKFESTYKMTGWTIQ